jgi:cytochrome c oxidase subunit 2
MWGVTGSHTDVLAHAGGLSRTPETVFNNIYVVFLALGTLVGVVVISYTLYNAIKYRQTAEGEGKSGEENVVRPKLGELPRGSGGGRKLFVSFGISAVIVLSLIVWTYSALLFVEDGAAESEELEIDVVGQQFSWMFVYPNGHRTTELRVPEDRPVELNVTSTDVFHNIGIPEFNAKTDAIPGQTTSAWFVPDETGTFEAVCYELCGSGHSVMRSPLIVMEPDAYEKWYANTTSEQASAAASDSAAVTEAPA